MTVTIPFSGSTLRSPDRAWRLVWLRTLHDLRRSVYLRRPISLPNLLRLYRRRVAAVLPSGDAAVRTQEQKEVSLLRRIYLQQQPFSPRQAHDQHFHAR